MNYGNITLIQTNASRVNSIASEIPIKIIEKLKENSNCSIEINFGSVLGLKIFSGIGPKITGKISNTGNVETLLKSKFEEQGINQTLHKMYLEIKMDVSILTPYKTIDTTIKNQVLISESIIVGKIPSSYYNLNTSDSSNALKAVGK